MPMLMWAGTDEWRAEAAHVERYAGRFDATGVQLGTGPRPYRLDYVLETTAGWVTRSLNVTVQGDGWRRTLALTRDPQGRWSGCATAAALDDALDCDLGFSPLTNSMPILRHGLHQGGAGVVDCTMAWVSVPDLTVHRSTQRYEHLRTTPRGADVRFASGDFTADLAVDADGFVVEYPQLASAV